MVEVGPTSLWCLDKIVYYYLTFQSDRAKTKSMLTIFRSESKN